MEELVVEFARYTESAIEAMAVLIIAFGSLEAFGGIVRLVFTRADSAAQRAVWLRFAHWLVAGMTFQLAGDVVSTTIAPSWLQIAQVGAIAVIRAFLSFCLDRDLEARVKAQEQAEA
jgi:uncharacterized membrane protein